MRLTIRIVLILVVGIIGFVFHIFYSTGYFRKIEKIGSRDVFQSVPIAGVEDMAMSRQDSFLILSAFDRAGHRDGQKVQGALYLIDLTVDKFEPVLLTGHIPFDFAPHGISLFRVDSGSYQIWVVSHPGSQHTIELFELLGNQLTHLKTFENSMINSPNDLVVVGPDQFYVTNDHKFIGGIGRLAEDYLGLSLSNVVYYDGTSYREVADGIAYANGINYDPNQQLIYVASPRDFLVNVYDRESDGDLRIRNRIDANTGVDNIELDVDGSLWIGCHPNLMAFASYAKKKKALTPSEIIHIQLSGDDYIITSEFVDHGNLISGTTVAIPFGPYLFLGNVMDDHFLILKE